MHQRNMSPPPKTINNSDWPEVRFINGYAMFIGFLRMGVRGLSILVFTWATVVLLGGFVSDMGKKDFWCLTMITLVQTFSAGVFDSLVKRDSSHGNNPWKTLLAIASTVVKDMTLLRKKRRQLGSGSKRRKMVHGCMTIISYFLWVVQLLMLPTVLFPLLVVYLAGMYICTGISLWRLVWHASDNANRESNQRPALIVLYLLAVAQCALHSFKALYTWVKGVDLVEEVADSYSMDKELVSAYLHETMIGCTKDPTYSRRRNLITYALDLLMESKTNDSYLSGVQILGTLLKPRSQDFTISGQPYLIRKLLIKSASCGHMIQRLIETMGTESSDSREIRQHAARIAAHVADVIPLRYFPGGIPFLSFLLNTVENYPVIIFRCDDNWLVVQGLRIIQNLIADEDNCRIIFETQDLVSKITAPLSQTIHDNHHDKWSEVAEEVLKLMSRLMATPEKREELRQGMACNGTIISALGRSLECPKCEVLVIRLVIQILLDLSMDPSKIMDEGNSSMKFKWILLHIHLLPNHCFDKIRGSIYWERVSKAIARLAGENLVPRHLQGEGAMDNMFESVLADLTGALANAPNISSRVRAAEILEHLCRHLTRGGYLDRLKKAIVNVMPMVLKEILLYNSTREVIHTSASGNNVQSSVPDHDLEGGDVSHGNAQENISSSKQHIGEQPERRKLQEALISLCKSIWFKWYDEGDSELTRQLDEAAAKICAEQRKPVKSFPRLVFEPEESSVRP